MKRIIVVALAVFFTLAIAQYSQAGLINYDRRLKREGIAVPAAAAKPEVKSKTAKSAPAQELVVQGPDWMLTVPIAKSAAEKGYDINGDGKLQAAEVKIYLRDVVDEVNSSGVKTVDSGILKGYDRNQDGVINATEAAKIIADVNQ